MDVVELHDFVSLILGNRRRNTMDGTKQSNIQASKLQTVSSSGSSLTLPMEGQNHLADPEKLAVERSLGQSSQLQRVITAQDWTGDDDPDNSENWSSGKKAYHVTYVGVQCFIVYV